MSQDDTIQVKIYSPSNIYFNGRALSLSAVNDTGPFDVLARHKNFMSLLRPCDVKVRRPDNSEFILPIARGVLHVKANHTTVFLDV